jgi:hypothetical protein
MRNIAHWHSSHDSANLDHDTPRTVARNLGMTYTELWHTIGQM